MTIERIAAGGDGVGRLPDGMTVFVPRTAPGDVAEIEVTERHRRYARGRVLALETRSTLRVEPACQHYEADACGGCQLQHLSEEAQREWKARIVGDALRRIAKRDVQDPAIVAAPSAWRYRTKITLHVSADGSRIGFHPWDRPGHVFQLDDCRIAREALMRLWRVVRGAALHLPRGVESVVLREDRTGALHVVLLGGTPPWDPAALMRAIAMDGVSCWWQPRGGAARVVAGPSTGFPALAFAQIFPDLADRIRQDAMAGLGPVEAKVVWDLYGGVGDAARALADAGAKVWSVDADRTAIAWAERQGGTGRRITYVAGRVEEVLHRLPEPDLVILNPPRAGCHPRVTEALTRLASRVSRVAYVSCDPATLARDLGRMPGFGIVQVTACDLFPQTSHVETVAILEA
ncbi:MAG TPA: TRAM domain-containing protein, partial [Gemmatimonadales bacterium]|nr:TRAM domain-containing protein [Gemmatimonadales bacterium]